MIFREAQISDIEQMMIVRLSVKENILSNPSLVTYEDMVEYLTIRGKGWVCEINNTIVGFSIGDLKGNSVWALFILPQSEGKGIGKKLQTLMLNWYFEKTTKNIWLETAADTRAEKFYKTTGWKETERNKRQPSNSAFPPFVEVKLELSKKNWKKNNTF